MRKRICTGVYTEMEWSKEKALSIDCKMTVRWYGYPFLAWKWVRENMDVRPFGYPFVFWMIAKHWFLWLVRGEN